MAVTRASSQAGDRPGQRDQDIVGRPRHRRRRADHVAQRPEPDLLALGAEPRAIAAWPSSWIARATSSSTSQAAVGRDRVPRGHRGVEQPEHHEQDQEDVDPDLVPDQRPRLIGDHVKGSVMSATRRRLRNHRPEASSNPSE